MSKKKYVIESAFENVSVQKIMQLGLDANGRIINWTDSIEDVEELNSDYINDHYGSLQDEAYQRGHDDGYEAGCATAFKPVSDAEYQRGLEDAWAAVKRIFGYEIDGGFPINKVREAFGIAENAIFCTADIIRDYTAQEAIDKIKAYEDKPSDRIEVGDEAKWNSDVIVITRVYEDGGFNWCDGVSKDGRAYHVLLENVKKTGKHYDIASILEAMRK